MKILVAYNKTLTSKKGVLESGQEIGEGFWDNQEEVVKDLLEKGYLMPEADYKKALHYRGEVPVEAPVEAEAEAEKEDPPTLKLGGAKKK